MVMSGGGQHPRWRGTGTVDNMRMVWMVHMTVPESLRNHLKLWRLDEDLGGGREGISSMDIPARAPQPVRVRPEEEEEGR